MAQIAAAPQRRNLALWSLAFLGVGLLSILPLSLLNPAFGNGSSGVPAIFERTRIAYFEFNLNADTLWLADPASPSSRIKSLTIPHAPEYGVIPSLSPDRRSVAYSVLPPETPAPGPDSPAELWVASLKGGRPTQVASDVDLLVPSVWTPDGKSLVFRRSDNLSRLFTVGTNGSGERELQTSANALFPVAFDGADDFLYVEMSESGSVLHRLDVAAAKNFSLPLSDGLTRDWTLSPDGKTLAYLEMTLNGQQATARAFVLNLATEERSPVGDPDKDAFNPTWDVKGSLIIGQLAAGSTENAAAVITSGAASALAAPNPGFDVPLEAVPSGGVAVTSFDGKSLVNPGRASLVVVRPDGTRQEIAAGEVTFLGWITP